MCRLLPVKWRLTARAWQAPNSGSQMELCFKSPHLFTMANLFWSITTTTLGGSWVTSGNARPALAVIPHGDGVCPPCVATTSTAVCRGYRLDSAPSLPFPALVWDAEIDWLIRQPALHCFRVRISQSAAMWLKSMCLWGEEEEKWRSWRLQNIQG